MTRRQKSHKSVHSFLVKAKPKLKSNRMSRGTKQNKNKRKRILEKGPDAFKQIY